MQIQKVIYKKQKKLFYWKPSQLSKQNQASCNYYTLNIRLLVGPYNYLLKFNYNAQTTIGELIQFLKTYIGSKNVVFKYSNISFNYGLTLLHNKIVNTFQYKNKKLVLNTNFLKKKNFPKNTLKQYTLLMQLSRKNYGGIYLAQVYGVYVVLKVYKKSYLLANELQIKVLNEKNSLLQFESNPFCSKLYAAFETKKYFCFSYQYISGITIQKLLQRQTVGQKMAKFIFSQLLCIILEMQKRKHMHRDIKPQNIMINFDGHIKLIDFQNARYGGNFLFTITSGTHGYLAREMQTLQLYNYACDIFSLGVVLYQLLINSMPCYFQLESKQRILNTKKLQNINEDAADLIIQLLKPDPKTRITIDQIINHPWLNDISMKDVINKKLQSPFRYSDCMRIITTRNLLIKQGKFQIDNQQMKEQKQKGDLLESDQVILKIFYYQSQELKRARQQIQVISQSIIQNSEPEMYILDLLFPDKQKIQTQNEKLKLKQLGRQENKNSLENPLILFQTNQKIALKNIKQKNHNQAIINLEKGIKQIQAQLQDMDKIISQYHQLRLDCNQQYLNNYIPYKQFKCIKLKQQIQQQKKKHIFKTSNVSDKLIQSTSKFILHLNNKYNFELIQKIFKRQLITQQIKQQL